MEYKLTPIDYFMDELEEWEVADLYNVMQFTDRNQWEIGRLVGYFTCLPYMKHKIPIGEFLELPFDENANNTEHNYEISNDEIEKLKKMSKGIEEKMKGEA